MKFIIFVLLILQLELYAHGSQPVLLQRSFEYFNNSEMIEVLIEEGVYGVSISIIVKPIRFVKPDIKLVNNGKKWVVEIPDAQTRGLKEIDFNSLTLKMLNADTYEFSFYEKSEEPRPRRTFLIKDKKLVNQKVK